MYDACMTDENTTPDRAPDLGILYVRLAPGLKGRLQACAGREGTSVTRLVNDLIDASFTPSGRRRKNRG
jgi:hypothetical protein